MARPQYHDRITRAMVSNVIALGFASQSRSLVASECRFLLAAMSHLCYFRLPEWLTRDHRRITDLHDAASWLVISHPTPLDSLHAEGRERIASVREQARELTSLMRYWEARTKPQPAHGASTTDFGYLPGSCQFRKRDPWAPEPRSHGWRGRKKLNQRTLRTARRHRESFRQALLSA